MKMYIALIKKPAIRNPGVITEIKITIMITEAKQWSAPSAIGATSWSTASISFENRFIICPRGVESKNRNFARVTASKRRLWIFHDAEREPQNSKSSRESEIIKY